MAGIYNYAVVVVLMLTGLYVVVAHGNLIKKVIGLNIFQTSVFIMYISFAKLEGGTAPILAEGIDKYSNPLPPRVDSHRHRRGGGDHRSCSGSDLAHQRGVPKHRRRRHRGD